VDRDAQEEQAGDGRAHAARPEGEEMRRHRARTRRSEPDRKEAADHDDADDRAPEPAEA